MLSMLCILCIKRLSIYISKLLYLLNPLIHTHRVKAFKRNKQRYIYIESIISKNRFASKNPENNQYSEIYISPKMPLWSQKPSKAAEAASDSHFSRVRDIYCSRTCEGFVWV